MRRALFVVAVLFACGPEAVPTRVQSQVAIVDALEFARETRPGVSAGFDLDGRVSDHRDRESCFQPDFAGLNGEDGVDNQLAVLLPLLDVAGENAVQSLVQQAINEGRLLVMFELLSTEGGDTDLVVHRGMDVPLLGTDGRLLPGQTLVRHPDDVLGRSDGVQREGNVVTAGPFALRIPVVVFTVVYEIALPKAYVRFAIDDAGRFVDGTIGGGIPVEQLFEILRKAGTFAQDFESLFGGAVREVADMDRSLEGTCSQMSAALRFAAAPGFIFD